MGMAVTAVWDQDSYRFRNDDGSETTATWMTAGNNQTPADIPLDTPFRLRFLVQETAGSNQGETLNVRIQARIDSGGGFGSWVTLDLNTLNTVDTAVSSGLAAGINSATKQIGSGTFTGGQTVSIANITQFFLTGGATAGNDEFEFEYTLNFNSAGMSAGDVVEFRLVNASTLNPFTTYTNTPSVTVQGAATIAPNAIASGETVHQPTLIFSQTVSPNTIASSESVPNPTLQAGSVSILPDHIASGETVHEPTLVQGAAQIIPGVIASTETVYNVTLTPGAATIVPNAIASGETVYQPTVTQSGGTQNVLPDTIASGETVYQPTLLAGSVTIAPNTIASSETVHQPTLVAGATAVVPDHIASTETVHEPAVSQGQIFIQPNTIASAETIHQPALLAGSVTVQPNTIASSEVVHNPTIVSGVQTVSPDHIASGEVVHNPTIAPGAVTVTPDVITSGEAVHQPTLAEFTASEIVVPPGAGGGGAAKKRREAAAIAPFIRWGKKKRKKPAEQVKEVASAVMQVVRQADKVPEINVNVPVEIDYKQIAEQLLEQKKLSELRQQQFDTFAKAVSVTLKRAEREIINREDEEVLLMALW